MSTFIIAEAGVNHNGSEDLALQLIDVAVEQGADAIKFQSFKADLLVKKGTSTAAYQQQQTGNNDQHAMLQQLEMSEAMHNRIIAHCHACDIEFMSTPFDLDSADFLIERGMSRIKLPSGELTNIPFLERLAAYDKELILSTGMADLAEVKAAVSAIDNVRNRSGFIQPLEDILTVLHCTSNYPASLGDVNLRAMQTMAKELGLPVGYSDHTDGILVAVAAVAMGAVVIEKHFTLDKTLAGPDHKASLESDELGMMIQQIRQIETCMGDGMKEARPSELAVRDVVRRSIVLACDKQVGDLLSDEDLVLLRPGTGIAPGEIRNVIGRRIKVDKAAGSLLQWGDLLDA
ncbi:MAG: N-acetylneuraminate synthase [Gammaproteobacteria bacterium]|nr:N-acetylneuraminate synthase [Gammaproteobacteria bacterium]